MGLLMTMAGGDQEIDIAPLALLSGSAVSSQVELHQKHAIKTIAYVSKKKTDKGGLQRTTAGVC